MQDEAKFARYLDGKLQQIPRSTWFTIQQRSIRGVPDRIGSIAGYFVALELKKSSDARRAKLQEYNLRRIKSSGGFAEFCYPENAESIIGSLLRISKGDFSWTQYHQA